MVTARSPAARSMLTPASRTASRARHLAEGTWPSARVGLNHVDQLVLDQLAVAPLGEGSLASRQVHAESGGTDGLEGQDVVWRHRLLVEEQIHWIEHFPDADRHRRAQPAVRIAHQLDVV